MSFLIEADMFCPKMNKKYSSESFIQALIMKNTTTLPPIKIGTNILFVMLVLLFSTDAVAQHGQYLLNHEINTNCVTGASDSNGLTPFLLEKNSGRSRFLYLGSELNSRGAQIGTPREITSLAFYVTDVKDGPDIDITNYKINLAQINKNTVTLPMSMLPIVGSQEVYSISSFRIIKTGWFEISFDAGFLWDGESNIVVEICKTNSSTPLGADNVKVATTTFNNPNDNRSWGLFTRVNSHATQLNGCAMTTASVPSNTLALQGSRRKERPNIRFTFKCDGNPIAGNTAIRASSNYCSGVVLDVINGERSSNLNYQWYYSVDDSNYIEIIGATLDTLVVFREDVDYYYYRATGCQDPDLGRRYSHSILVKGINTWNGANWSMGCPPNAAEPLKIAGDFDTNDHGGIVEACSIEFVSGNIIVRSEHTLKIKDKVKVAPASNVVFENNASLVQENNVLNEGEIKYRRNSQPVRLMDYTYWSSPVSGQTPSTFSVGTPNNRIYFWNHLATVQNWNAGVHNTPMGAGKGYIIRAPNGFPNTGAGQLFHGEFKGVPHNGEISVATQGENPNPTGAVYWNLIGNPYPSALDADLFLLANSNSIDGTLKFWTHNSIPSGTYPGNHTFNYNSNDYATYNFTGTVGAGTGHVGTITDPNDPGYIPNTTEPGRYIAAGQSFMVAGGPVSGVGTVTFKNNMRVVGENKTFFRTANAIETVGKNRIWLEMKHEDGAFKQTLVGYIEGATNGLDWGFDGKMLETSPVLIYTKSEEQNLIIQGKALPFAETDQIPLGFSTTLAGNFELNLYRFDGLFVNQTVYIEDTYTNTIYNLKDGVFSFHTTAGVFDDRFVLRFNNETLSLPSAVGNPSSVLCFAKNDVINLKTFSQTLTTVAIFDVSGRMLYQNKAVNAIELKIETIAQQNQLLLVQVTTEEGLKSTYKLIY